ncbi:hypothetical protein P7M37_24470, partial [Vibrio parahaemolyticus]|nr:hypothetical protein [Vibrio parahaemolyticus]
KKGLATPTLTLRLEKNCPGFFYFFQPITIVLGGATAKILLGGNRFWCNTPTKISPTGREPWQKNGYIPARPNTAKVSKGRVENCNRRW